MVARKSRATLLDNCKQPRKSTRSRNLPAGSSASKVLRQRRFNMSELLLSSAMSCRTSASNKQRQPCACNALKTTVAMDVPSPLTSIASPGAKIGGDLLHRMRGEVAGLLGRKNLSFPGAQPISFARRHLEELTRTDYYLCEKTDGMRYLLYLTEGDPGQEVLYLIDRRNDYWYVPDSKMHIPKPGNPQGFHTNTLLDGELVIDKDGDGKIRPRFMVFDCLVWNSQNLMQKTLDKRIGYYKENIQTPFDDLFRKVMPEEADFLHFLIKLKAFQLPYYPENMFNMLKTLPHGHDGLIYTCKTTPYKHGTDPNILKWKPEDENSIDLRMALDFPVVQPDSIDKAQGITKPYFDYDAVPICNLLVFLGDNKQDKYFGSMHIDEELWTDFKSRLEPMNDRIVECYMDEHKRWRFMKFRDDKETANHVSTVESVMESIEDRVTKEDLIAIAPKIRVEWKKREAAAKARDQADQAALNNKKRKAEEQSDRRPSPTPPGGKP
ncbi:mRNA capping enzyme, catalytic domain-containing protein [Calycina marina]|uniref:mRNA guanylyltransferase n=1 Tax=Calycina marina TaxID=1763456 RepID=A0A9P7Z5U0_9HELO|nr:mRNA capping enzyme, catalytic domain-containing protein [Calycina marina]